MWGMRQGQAPSGFDDLLRRKYDQMQQQIDIDRTKGNAAANFDVVRAGLLPAAQEQDILESRANIAKTGAETSGILTNNDWIGRLNQSQIGYQGALGYQARTSGNLNTAQVGKTNVETKTGQEDLRLGLLGYRRDPANTDLAERRLRLGLSR